MTDKELATKLRLFADVCREQLSWDEQNELCEAANRLESLAAENAELQAQVEALTVPRPIEEIKESGWYLLTDGAGFESNYVKVWDGGRKFDHSFGFRATHFLPLPKGGGE